MNEETKKYVMIGFTIACLCIAGFMFYRTFFGGEPGQDTNNRDMALLCKTCGGFEIPMNEFREHMSKNPPDMMMPMMGPGEMMTIPCPKCGKKTCYMAQKCPKCAQIFVYGQSRDQNFPDRCPKCAFSAMEDYQKNPTAK